MEVLGGELSEDEFDELLRQAVISNFLREIDEQMQDDDDFILNYTPSPEHEERMKKLIAGECSINPCPNCRRHSI